MTFKVICPNCKIKLDSAIIDEDTIEFSCSICGYHKIVESEDNAM